MKDDRKANKNIRKDDTVMVHTGACKGQTGKVFRRDGDKVFVQGLNKVKKHVKKSQQNQAGGILEVERPIHVSKLSVVVEGNTPVKLKARTTAKGGRELYYEQEGKEVVYRQLNNKNRTS
jgi:large subunit ribosomal protein L24